MCFQVCNHDQPEKPMQAKSMITATMAVLILSAGAAMAQSTIKPTTSDKPAAKQSAPAESPQAAGHDAQSGQPETGPNATKTQGAASDGYKDAQDKDKK
jgi:hypothetical protein